MGEQHAQTNKRERTKIFFNAKGSKRAGIVIIIAMSAARPQILSQKHI